MRNNVFKNFLFWAVNVIIWIAFIYEIVLRPCFIFYGYYGFWGVFHWLGFLIGGAYFISMVVSVVLWFNRKSKI